MSGEVASLGCVCWAVVGSPVAGLVVSFFGRVLHHFSTRCFLLQLRVTHLIHVCPRGSASSHNCFALVVVCGFGVFLNGSVVVSGVVAYLGCACWAAVGSPVVGLVVNFFGRFLHYLSARCFLLKLRVPLLNYGRPCGSVSSHGCFPLVVLCGFGVFLIYSFVVSSETTSLSCVC
ncbi:hypothetical protein BS78_03G208000 [Paspalum vaginatum]|nr:hypothetical protein BS78_03G208000 [Paspalum vaginatum]